MGADTSIQWCHDTLNVWHGCAKVSLGCKHCYAEVSTPVRVKRAAGLEVWGAQAARSETKSWEANLRSYARKAIATGQRRRVFLQSLADTFEDYRGGRIVDRDGGASSDTLDGLRARLFAAIADLMNYPGGSPLDMLLLTKRPENVLAMVPFTWRHAWPGHVWIGATVEDQDRADERIPHLLRIPAAVRFLSVEPQIGPVDLSYAFWTSSNANEIAVHGYVMPPGGECPISWVICGGESGPKARPFDLAWARSLRDQCKAAGVAFFMKQLGAQPHDGGPPGRVHFHADGGYGTIRDSHGGDESEWPADLRGCRAFPETRS